MINTRDEFLHAFCDTCIKPVHHFGCGETFKAILEPIQCPDELIETHIICPFCTDLYPRDQDHETKCLFAQEQLFLHAGGWTTYTSARMWLGMRHGRFRYRHPVSNLIRILLYSVGAEGDIIIPVPVSTAGKTDWWLTYINDAVAGFESTLILPTLSREKHQSIRTSFAQVRSRIVEDEFSVNEVMASTITDHRVILIDDNVTTGTTMIHCARLIKPFGPAEIVPVTIERYISPRVQQRCPKASINACDVYVPKKHNTSKEV